MRVDLQPAYLLHTRPFRDTSVLADLLTLDYGLIRAVARGARGKSRRFPLQQHLPLLVSWSGRNELVTLTHAEQAAPGFRLLGDRLFCALYLNELLERMLPPHEANAELYRLYQSALLQLQQELPLECVLRCFEWRMLAALGYQPDLASVSPDQYYEFCPETGLVVATPGVSSFAGSDLLALSMFFEQGGDDFNAAFAKRLLRGLLRPYLGDRPLMSRTLFSSALNPGQRRLPADDNTG
jgi:DNA repair protein RecO (recombination protein O)